MTSWHPALPLVVLAALLPVLQYWPGVFAGRRRIRQGLLLLAPLMAILMVALLPEGSWGHVEIFRGQQHWLVVDRLSLLFAWVFALMALIGSLFSLHHDNWREHCAALLYVAGALCVVFAGDFLSLFVGWELMAFASAYLVFAPGHPDAVAAGQRYLLVHIAGGLCLMAGILLHYHQAGSLAVVAPDPQQGPAFYLILAGVLLNAAVPPLNAWLTDAYPEASVSGAVFMCAFTTKTAIYVLLRLFPGTELLIALGTIMAVYGVIYAVLENDCRRLLAYHIVSQVGYMVAAVGIGTPLALNGAAAHAFAHILYKALLFMGAGAAIYVTGRRKLTELGGLYRTMPVTLTLYMIGALSISAFPLFSGFVSKSMVVSAAEQQHLAWVTLMLTLASAGTFLHTGLKLPYYLFFGKDQGIVAHEPPATMRWAMALAALCCIVIGVFPALLYQLLPYPVEYQPYTPAHITGSLAMLLFTALGFYWLLKHLDPEDTISLDTDWSYRRGARGLMWLAHHPLARYEQWQERSSNRLLNGLHRLAARGLKCDHHIIDALVNGIAHSTLQWGARLRHWQSGLLSHYALAMIAGLALCLLLYVGVF